MIGYMVGTLIGIILAVIPTILIARSKQTSGKTKIIWVLSVLLVPFILKIIAGAIVLALQGNTMAYGLGPIIPLTWYLTAWGIYYYFKKKYKLYPAKEL